MCDELWEYHHNPTTKQESPRYFWKGVLLVAFFDLKGMIYYRYILTINLKTTVNSEYYVKVHWKLHEHVQQKHPAISKIFILY